MDTYLRSKLYAPSPGDSVVPRQRLFAVLDSVYDNKSVFISAPAGYGKTTTVTAWLRERSLPCAWVSLDEDDDNPGRLLTYICAAVGKFLPDIFKPDATDQYALLDKLLYALQDCGRELVIVLDDFHHIANPLIIHMMLHFIQYKPPGVCLIIASRGDVPLPFKPVLLKQQMVLIKNDQLLFDGDEIRDFFRLRELPLDRDQTDALQKRTEGWPCALVALSLAAPAQMEHTIASLENNEFIHSFLLNEVWRLWDDETRDFLLQTSILNEFSIELVRIVTEMEHCEDILGRISANRGFVVTLSGRERWYRYHHVFRDFLRGLLYKDTRFDEKELQRRAAGYYRDSGDIVRALSYYRAAEDHGDILDLIENDSARLFWSVDANEILKIIDGIGSSAFDRLRVCICYGWALQFTKIKRQAALPFIGMIEEKLEAQRRDMDPTEVERVRLEISAMSFSFSLRAGDYGKMIENMEGIFSRQHLDAIIFEPYHILFMYGHEFSLLNTVFGFFGSINEYLDFMEKTQYSGYAAMRSYRITGAMPIGRAEVLYQAGRIDEAIPYLSQGLDESARQGIVHAYLPGMLCLADIQKAGGDIDGAYQTVSECRAKLKSLDEISALNIADAYRARLDLEFNRMDEVSRWESDTRVGPYDDIVTFHSIYQHLVLTMVLIESGKWTLAHLLLNKIQLLFTGLPTSNYIIYIRYLKAHLALREGKAEEARTAIAELFNMGHTCGYYRFFADRGQDMKGLLIFGLKEKVYEMPDSAPLAYMERLLAMTEDYIEKTGEYRKPVPSTDVSGVTPREREILACMAQNLTNQEIADRLYVSLQTVKNHTSSIYRKLNVTSRMQAVSAARETGLI